MAPKKATAKSSSKSSKAAAKAPPAAPSCAAAKVKVEPDYSGLLQYFNKANLGAQGSIVITLAVLKSELENCQNAYEGTTARLSTCNTTN